MTKKEIILELLQARKAEVEEYRRNFEYGEWSCGQQDSDAEEAEHYDKVMRNAITIVTSIGTGRQTLSAYNRAEAKMFIAEVLEDFRLSVTLYYEL